MKLFPDNTFKMESGKIVFYKIVKESAHDDLERGFLRCLMSDCKTVFNDRRRISDHMRSEHKGKLSILAMNEYMYINEFTRQTYFSCCLQTNHIATNVGKYDFSKKLKLRWMLTIFQPWK